MLATSLGEEVTGWCPTGAVETTPISYGPHSPSPPVNSCSTSSSPRETPRRRRSRETCRSPDKASRSTSPSWSAPVSSKRAAADVRSDSPFVGIASIRPRVTWRRCWQSGTSAWPRSRASPRPSGGLGRESRRAAPHMRDGPVAAVGVGTPGAARVATGGDRGGGGGHHDDHDHARGRSVVTRDRIGLQQWSIRDAITRLDGSVSGYLGGRGFPYDPTDLGPAVPLPGGFASVFRYLASVGYRGFEFYSFNQGANGAITMEQLRSALDRAGLVAAGSHTGGLQSMIDTRAIRDRARRPRGCSPTGSAGRDRPTRSAPRLGRSASSTSFSPNRTGSASSKTPHTPSSPGSTGSTGSPTTPIPRHRCIGRWAAGTTSVPADAHRTGRHSGSARAVPRGQSGTHARQSEVRMIEFLLARALQRLPKQLRSRYEAEWRADLAVLGDRRLASLRWAIGLQRAASELRAQSGLKRPTRLPRLTATRTSSRRPSRSPSSADWPAWR